MPGQLKKSRKNAPKALIDKVLEQLAELADVPAEQHKSFFESVRTRVQTACELDALAKGAMANKKGTILHQAALTLYDKLGNLNNTERALLGAVLSNAQFGFDRISSEGVAGLRKTAYELSRLFSLVTGKAPPRKPNRSSLSRQGGRGTLKHPRFQKFVCDLLISTKAAGGNLTVNPYGRDGTLIDAIKMLAPYLPDGFGPSSLSFMTFQRLKTKAGKAKQT